MRNYTDYPEDDDDLYAPQWEPMKPKVKRTHSGAIAQLAAPGSNVEGGFKPSFSGREDSHERQWIMTYLSPFYDDHIISDVLRQVKGGKEAQVYCCRADPGTGMDLIAAKVYRPRMFRNLRNDAQYREGRDVLSDDGKAIRDRRTLVAVKKGTNYGQSVTHTSWLAHEFETMRLLHAAGADVPRPITHSDNAILMEYMGDVEMPAPTLNNVAIDRDEAEPLFRKLMANVELMLARDRIHGDLSAYNVLYWDGDVKIIDFPQVIDAYNNPSAYKLFGRDVERLCQYFTKFGLRVDPVQLTREMWSRAMADDTYEARKGRF